MNHQGAVDSESPNDKVADPYLKSIEIGREVLALHTECKKHDDGSPEHDALRNQILQRFEQLLAHCVENCDEIPSHDCVEEELYSKPTNFLGGGCSLSVSKTVIPLAVIRELFKNNAVDIRLPLLLREWVLFHEKYKSAIIGI